MAASPAARDVHLVGSVPFKDATEVFRTASAILGDRLRHIPDGETGDRRNWVAFQYLLLSRHPQFGFAKTPEDRGRLGVHVCRPGPSQARSEA